MTIAKVAVGAIAGGGATGPRLALPGAVLLFAGGALLYWGMGIFRSGEVNGSVTRRFASESVRDAINAGKPRASDAPTGSGGTGGSGRQVKT